MYLKLTITEPIEYKLLSLTNSSQSPNLHICITLSLFNLLAALALHLLALAGPPISSSLEISWNQLLASLLQPDPSLSISDSPLPMPVT